MQATAAVFMEVFGSAGDHLWRKYVQENDFLRFWGQLDTANQSALLTYINETYQ